MALRFRHLVVVLALAVALFLWLRTPRSATADAGPPETLNNTLGFQHIFAINLPARTDRRDALTLAAALSELDISWVDGVAGDDVLDKVLPGKPSDRANGFTVGNKGSWRAHMNVLQRIVRHNITSALILEDDADWDVRLKSQMRVFARAARAFTQPSPNGQTLAEQSRPPSKANNNHDPIPGLPLSHLPHLPAPRTTPYGDDWDVLWLGHCGTDFPDSPATTSNTPTPNSNPPLLRVTIPNDPTVPPPQHLHPHPFALQDRLAGAYPPHTRVVHAARGTACTQAYAVSQRGARRLLRRFGLETLTAGWDLMVRDWCDGDYHYHHGNGKGEGKGGGTGGVGDGEGDGVGKGRERRAPVCVTVQPPLFSHHYGRGAASDIMAPGGGFVNKEREMTPYIRVSVRLNLERLVEGEEGRDQWGD